MRLFDSVFPRRPVLIGMLHVWEGSLRQQIEQAKADVEALVGFDGVLIENYGWGQANANEARDETIRRLIAIRLAITLPSNMAIGYNVLPNDYEHALNLADFEDEGGFIQLDHVTGEFIGVESVDPDVLYKHRELHPQVCVIGGIQPKYYRLCSPEPIEVAARRAVPLTHAIVVTGSATGREARLDDLRAVRKEVGNHPVIIGSGFTADNAVEQLQYADGAIIGTALKRRGVVPWEPIDPVLVERMLTAVRTG